jgi:hypothetical protein
VAALCLVTAAVLMHGRISAVTASPIAVYLDERNRHTSLTLFNNGELAEEIEVAFGFGYPYSDSLGVIHVDITDEAPAGEPSLLPWVRAFPQRILLQPGQRQVLRVLVEPPADVATGEYWGRILLKSRGGRPPIEQRQGNVTMQIEVETVLALPVIYRQGNVNSAVEVMSFEAVPEGDSIRVVVDLRRTGNAAFVGRVVAELLDDAQQVIASAEVTAPVTYDLRRVLYLPRLEGAAHVRMRIDNRRDDLPAAAPLPLTPIVRSVRLSAT